mmetsp:Transcript_6282/g.13428  ORF Transcript_6282/g.13428 Transcript_6282/m.13428 type:complete len:311 (+) Transcript_6282:207-1139(+)
MLSRSSLTISHSLRRLAAAPTPAYTACSKMRLLSTPANTVGFPAPVLFDYETIKNNLTVSDAISSVEEAFGALARGKVDVPMPMHIGIEESEAAGPGDCHIKGGYVFGEKTFTVKLACVSFYKNVTERNLPAGSGVFVVVDAAMGCPLGIFQENRIMTDLRTGAAGAVAVKYTTPDDDSNVIGFIGTGAIARNMARAAAAVRPTFTGVAYGLDIEGAETFAKEMSEELGVEFSVASSSEELCQRSNVIFTQTTGSDHVLNLEHLRKGTTIIASGSDQSTKQELPNDVLASADKYVADLINQTSRVGGKYF